MFICGSKALDVKQNEKGHIQTHQQVFIFLMFLSQNPETVEKTSDVKQTENGHVKTQTNIFIFVIFL